jgi:hypothetical protein
VTDRERRGRVVSAIFAVAIALIVISFIVQMVEGLCPVP